MQNRIKQFVECIQDGRLDEIDGMLSDQVKLHSPVNEKPIEDRALASMAIRTALSLLLEGEFSFVQAFRSEAIHMLEFTSTIGGMELNVLDQIECDENGQIIFFKVFLRPQKAANLFCERMIEQMTHQLSSAK